MSHSDQLKMRMLRRLTFVPRWVILPTNRRQSVAEHTFGVVAISRVLLSMHASGHLDTFKLQVLNLALDHDIDEALSGDSPSTNKEYSSPTPSTPQEKIVVKCADYLEALMFIWEERLLGNTFGLDYVENDLVAKLHDYWQLFNFCPHEAATSSSGLKTLTSDLIRMFRDIAFSRDMPHPSLFK